MSKAKRKVTVYALFYAGETIFHTGRTLTLFAAIQMNCAR